MRNNCDGWNCERSQEGGRVNMAPEVHCGRSVLSLWVSETGWPLGTVTPDSVHYRQWPLEAAVLQFFSQQVCFSLGRPLLSRPRPVSLCRCCSVWLSNRSGPVPLFPRCGGSYAVRGWKRRPTDEWEEDGCHNSTILSIYLSFFKMPCQHQGYLHGKNKVNSKKSQTINKKLYTLPFKNVGSMNFFETFLCSPRLQLLDQKYITKQWNITAI